MVPRAGRLVVATRSASSITGVVPSSRWASHPAPARTTIRTTANATSARGEGRRRSTWTTVTSRSGVGTPVAVGPEGFPGPAIGAGRKACSARCPNETPGLGASVAAELIVDSMSAGRGGGVSVRGGVGPQVPSGRRAQPAGGATGPPATLGWVSGGYQRPSFACHQSSIGVSLTTAQLVRWSQCGGGPRANGVGSQPQVCSRQSPTGRLVRISAARSRVAAISASHVSSSSDAAFSRST